MAKTDHSKNNNSEITKKEKKVSNHLKLVRTKKGNSRANTNWDEGKKKAA